MRNLDSRERRGVLLSVIFNHKYEANLSKLDTLYSQRFPDRIHLMPFADSRRADVMAVFEAGARFEGHIAQTSDFYQQTAFSHYLFIGDDLVLNPKLNAQNIIDHLSLRPDEGYIKSIASADSLRYVWPWAGEASMTLRKSARGLDLSELLPNASESQRKFETMGLTFRRPVPRSASELLFAVGGGASRSLWAYAKGLGVTGRRSQYPLLSGYSDFIVVPGEAIELFSYYCGVFAALGLFAEVAVPTALVLACKRVRTELPVGRHFRDKEDLSVARNPAGLRGLEIWNQEESSRFLASFSDMTIETLVREFPAEFLYVHPIKLSRWT